MNPVVHKLMVPEQPHPLSWQKDSHKSAGNSVDLHMGGLRDNEPTCSHPCMTVMGSTGMHEARAKP